MSEALRLSGFDFDDGIIHSVGKPFQGSCDENSEKPSFVERFERGDLQIGLRRVSGVEPEYGFLISRQNIVCDGLEEGRKPWSDDSNVSQLRADKQKPSVLSLNVEVVKEESASLPPL